MKVKDLRIGNYITGLYEDLEGKEATALCKVVALDSVGVTDNTFWVESKETDIEKYDGFEGVEITKEVLLSFGLGLDPDYDNAFVDSASLEESLIIYDTKNKLFMLEGNRDRIEIKHIKYVHQFQNICFALTGKELEYKPF